jgi:N-acetylmuramic acid 6-phosphate (MurNAc-6-P) etherase
VKASNTKLRDRAARILQQLTGCDYVQATATLERTNWDIKSACKALSSK